MSPTRQDDQKEKIEYKPPKLEFFDKWNTVFLDQQTCGASGAAPTYGCLVQGNTAAGACAYQGNSAGSGCGWTGSNVATD